MISAPSAKWATVTRTARYQRIAAMKANGTLPAGARDFMNMSDATAKTFLDDFENAQLIVKNYLAEKEAP